MDSASSTPRRSQRIQKMAPETSTPSPSANDTSPFRKSTSRISAKTSRPSPLMPSTVEKILLTIYPTILLTGSLFSLLDPSARNAPYSATTQAHVVDSAPSYFAKKSNIFNKLFVKQGWAWITFSYIFFLFTHPSIGPPLSVTLTPRRLRGLLRYTIVTTWWIFVTQWFFGPAIIDRSFKLTGGQCELARQADKGNVEMDDTRQFITGVACKAVGGQWKGGHDISGHVFLLVLGSMFLFEEVLHVVLKSQRVKEERTVYMPDGAIKSAEVEAGFNGSDPLVQRPSQWTLGSKVGLGVAGLSVYMLLMTAAYFHTWFEKLTGLLVALSGIFVTYFLPRAVPELRNIIGMPGV